MTCKSFEKWLAEPASAIAPLLALSSVIFILICFPIWTGIVTPKWDADMQYIGFYSLLADCSRSLKLLLWSPWTSGGAPLFVLPGVGSFSPLTTSLSFLLGPTEEGFRAYWLVLWLTGLSGMTLFARHFRAPNWLCLVLGLGYAFSGIFTGHAQHTDFIYGMALLPWAILCLDRVLLAPSLVRAATSGLFFGILICGTYPGLAVGTFLIALAWLLCRLPETLPKKAGKRKEYLGTLIPALLVLGTITAAIGIPPYVSFLHETAGYSVREGTLDKAKVLSSNALTTASLSTLFNPYFANIAWLGGPEFAPTDVSSVSLYMGFLPLLLLVVALCFRKESKFQWALFASAVFFFLLACSEQFPLRSWLFEIFPPSRYFRHSSLFRIYSCFLLFAVIASRGGDWRELPVSKALNRKAFLAVASVIFLISVVQHVRLLWNLESPPEMEFPSSALALAFGILAPIAALALILAAMRKSYTKLALVGLVGLAAIDAAATRYLAAPTIFWHNPMARKHWDFINEKHQSELQVIPSRSEGVARNDNLIVKALELRNYLPLENPYFDSEDSMEVNRQIALGENRWWFAQDAMLVPSETQSHSSYLGETKHAGGVPLYIDSLEERQARGSNILKPISTQILEYMPNTLVLRVDAPSDGWFLATDRWSRSWKAFVDGAPSPLERGNFVFRAVKLSKGEHEIAFRYDISWLLPYLALSLIAFLVGAFCMGWEIKTFRKGKTR